MSPWLPAFACPECARDLETDAGARTCGGCGRRYAIREGIWRFLTPERAAAFDRFGDQYRRIRQRDGRAGSASAHHATLPWVPPEDPHAGEWRVRRETFAHLQERVLAVGPRSMRALDLGAGSGWLSRRLSARGDRAVAVDAVDHEVDGLGAACADAGDLVLVQADFEAPPFGPAQFDLVVFNASLHYAARPAAALARAHALLAPGGVLVVMDSPMFRRERDGRAMADGMAARCRAEHGIDLVRRPGFLTFASLDAAARGLCRRPSFAPSRGSWAWRLRRQAGAVRLGRQPAAFGLWVAR